MYLCDSFLAISNEPSCFVLTLNDLPWAELGFDLSLGFTVICLSEVHLESIPKPIEKNAL